MSDDIPSPEEFELAQNPVGCRYVFGDPGHGDWCYCQQTLAPGHALGNLAKPPYCEEHLPGLFQIETEAQRRRRLAYELRLAEGDPQCTGPGQLLANGLYWDADGQRMPTDFYVRHIMPRNFSKKGFSHD